ncbi:MAG: hypothetical protein H6657_25360 [Ardenticatenaceae bacterium]|nr:hypothetical protein [Ardenticatenaceae bacterium]
MRLKGHYFRIHWPNWRTLFRYWVLLCCCLSWVTAVQSASAQASESVSLTIQLRHSDGTAVVGEPIILERLPEEAPIPQNCVTNGSGSCSWTVGRGLYQVLFEQPLDDISSLAVAEGGLRGFGVTVGDSPITYHFTFHSDGRVYFDAVPEAAIPSPIIPAGELLHGGVEATVVSSPIPTEGIVMTATPSPRLAAPEKAADTAISDSSSQLLLFIGGGLCIGGGLHLWSRKRNKPVSKTTRRSGKEANDA